jgi:hypothetical protein
MGDEPNPNSRTIPVTIKITPNEAKRLKRLGGGASAGKGLRKTLNDYWNRSLLRSER